MFKKILYPVDFTLHAEAALPYVKKLAELHGAGIIMLHVADDLHHIRHIWFPIPEVQPYMDGMKDAAQKKMKEFREKHFPATFDVSEYVIMGDPATDIVQFIKEHTDIDLVVLGTHGHKGLERITFGSVADQVVRTSPVPVMTVNPHLNRVNLT